MSVNKYYNKILLFNKNFDTLIAQNIYIARSNYIDFINQYIDCYDKFYDYIEDGMLYTLCEKYEIDDKEIKKFVNIYNDIKNYKIGSKIIDLHNEKFIYDGMIKYKDYLDRILCEDDVNINLDEDQRRVILSDEDYTLVVAGAGAGKTTTIEAKVKYLVDKKQIKPDEILIVSFTNKAVDELKYRIIDKLHINCDISTFHSIGYTLIKNNDEKKKRIVSETYMYYVISNYLKNVTLKSPSLINKLILFFATYFVAPYDGNDINKYFLYLSKTDFESLKSVVGEYCEYVVNIKTNKKESLRNEKLRSTEEVQIANFLFVNSIEYIYEDIYPYNILKASKPYTPDFHIKQGEKDVWIEHFGITEDGKHNIYTDKELEQYKNEIKEKISVHKKHNTDLIYTYSKFNDNRDLLEHLKEELIKRGFVFKKKSDNEIYAKIINDEENSYIMKLVKLVCSFIELFKTNAYDETKFLEMKEKSKSNVRTQIFLDICEKCYHIYKAELGDDKIDFNDMINYSSNIINSMINKNEKLKYKYIIIDEYQDISQQRFKLVEKLRLVSNAKVIAVGDDWQSIYAFSGSKIELFLEFCKIMGYGKEMYIRSTFRNSQGLIDIAGNFIMKNSKQIKKQLISKKQSIKFPVVIETYNSNFIKDENGNKKGGKYYNLGKIVEKIIGQIIKLNSKEKKPINSSVLLIGRYGFDARKLAYYSGPNFGFIYDEKNKIIKSKKYMKYNITFLTAHSSKGLGADNVIIINARNEIYGFPSKVDKDPVFNVFGIDDHNIDYAEERRLFYVALTRTKNRVFIAVPEDNPSEFINELIKDNKDIKVIGKISENTSLSIGMLNKCPICGYPLQFKWNKNFGLKLWICTNEPELCGYMTNDLHGKKMSICKCPDCQDGYLVVKKKNSDYFLGCTNYKKDGSGCNKMLSKSNYKLESSFSFSNLNSKRKFNCDVDIKKIPVPKVSIKKNKPTIDKIRKDVETTKYAINPKFPNYKFIVDSYGKVLINMKVFLKLIEYFDNNEKCKDKIRISNSIIVSIATFLPNNKDEFMKIKGVGNETWTNFGNDIIEIVNKYK